jgi:protein-disulfide isomerase
MSKKAWIVFVGVCVVLLGVLIYISAKDKVDVSSVDQEKIQSSVEMSGGIADHVYGKKESKVTLIEYGDYQCPACGNAYPIVKPVVEANKNDIAFVFRNFPLTSIHPNALAGAASAEAAGLQNKYWEMHDLLYEGQSSWENLPGDQRTSFFADYAKTLGLNVDTFRKDIVSNKVNQKINFDIAIGKKIGVDATPTFYLNGKKLEQDTWGAKEKLDAAIKKALSGK